jgi:hypothetical protein
MGVAVFIGTQHTGRMKTCHADTHDVTTMRGTRGDHTAQKSVSDFPDRFLKNVIAKVKYS